MSEPDPTPVPSAAARLGVVLTDLAAETAALDEIVADVDDHLARRPVPGAGPGATDGWSIAATLGHLAFFDERGALAASDPDAFADERRRANDPSTRGGYMAAGPEMALRLDAADRLSWWRTGRARMLDAYRACDPDVRLAWFGPSMSVVSHATARLMEAWAHGVDICDALGHAPLSSMRLRHVCEIGVRTYGWSFRVRGAEVPDASVAVELIAPDGTGWRFGPDAAADTGGAGAGGRISGSALEFCLVVTQRRNVADTALAVDGDAAAAWMRGAQAFAGPPTLPPPAGVRPHACVTVREGPA